MTLNTLYFTTILTLILHTYLTLKRLPRKLPADYSAPITIFIIITSQCIIYNLHTLVTFLSSLLCKYILLHNESLGGDIYSMRKLVTIAIRCDNNSSTRRLGWLSIWCWYFWKNSDGLTLTRIVNSTVFHKTTTSNIKYIQLPLHYRHYFRWVFILILIAISGPGKQYEW